MHSPHTFAVDKQNIGTCPCGEVRQYPWDTGGQVVILKKGDPRYHDTKLTEKEKTVKTTGRGTGDHQHIRQRNRYYEQNRDAIRADLLNLGRPATRKKWNIPSSTLPGLVKRWLTKDQQSPSINHSHSNGRLPPLPQFSDNWDPSVQLEWLEVYRELATREKSTVSTTT